MILEFFKMNKINTIAQKLLYREFPEYFFWNKKDKI